MSEPVSKPIAIGLKEIGFDSPTVVYYEDSDDKIHGTYSTTLFDFNHREGYEDCYSAPTIDECVNWLLDKHGVYVCAYPLESAWVVYWYKRELTWVRNFIPESYDTRPQALTAGIEAAIQHLKNKMKDGTENH